MRKTIHVLDKYTGEVLFASDREENYLQFFDFNQKTVWLTEGSSNPAEYRIWNRCENKHQLTLIIIDENNIPF